MRTYLHMIHVLQSVSLTFQRTYLQPDPGEEGEHGPLLSKRKNIRYSRLLGL